MTKRSLTTIRLTDLLPAQEHDAALDAFAHQTLALKRDYFERLHAFLYPINGTWGMHDPAAPINPGAAMMHQSEGIIFRLALKAVKVRLICAESVFDARSFLEASSASGRDVPRGWRVYSPGLRDALGPLVLISLDRWVRLEAQFTRTSLASFLARLEQLASAKTDAGILALIGSLFLSLTSSLSSFDRLVERLTRRVLAPGGKTALFTPLN